jgi:hypothetical protein
MCLEINRLGWDSNYIVVNQSEDESDEFDGENELNIDRIESVVEIFPSLCEELQNSGLVRFRVEGFGEVP